MGAKSSPLREALHERLTLAARCIRSRCLHCNRTDPSVGRVWRGDDRGRSEHHPEASAPCGDPYTACDLSQFQTAGTNQVAPFDGVLVRWRVKGASGPMKPRVIRPFGGDSFTFISSGAIVSPPTTGIETFPTQLPIKLGDYFGVELTSSTSTFSYDSAGAHLGDKVASWTGTNLDGTTNIAQFGNGARF